MSGIVKDSLVKLQSFLEDYHLSFTNGLLILFTIGGEQIFKITAFDCPSTQPDAFRYACALMFIPPLILGLIGVAISNLTWRLFHGCTSRDETKTGNGFCNTFKHFCIVLSRAVIVPVAWLFITGLDGSYYACMLSSEPGDKSITEYEKIKKDSQVYSWFALLGLVIFALTVICIIRCRDSLTYEHYQFIEHYRRNEGIALDAAEEKSVQKMAEDNVKVFMENKTVEKKDWDDISRIPVIIPELAESAQSTERDGAVQLVKPINPKFFTYLHKWVSEHPPPIAESTERDGAAKPTERDGAVEPTERDGAATSKNL